MKLTILIIAVTVILASCNSKSSSKDENVSANTDTLQMVLHVERMTCDNCEMTVENSVNALAGIVSIKANYEDSSAVVKYDASKVSLASISGAIEKKGYIVVGEK